MKRRAFILALGGAAASLPFAARAQQGAGMPRIGVLLATSQDNPLTVASLAAFTKALQELGWTDGKNVRIDYRWAASDLERMQAFAKELVSLQPSVIVGHSTAVVVALKRETSTIPIVFISIAEPISGGLVASLSHPGGNITGFTNFEPSLAGKWIEILKDIVPRITRASYLFYPDTNPLHFSQQPLELAALSHGIELVAAPARNEADIERIIAGLADDPTVGLIIAGDPFFGAQHRLDLLVSLATRYRVPAIFPFRLFPAAGGLVSYGNNLLDQYRQAPTYVDRILRGANPADLPVQMPTRFELVINLRTAKAMGLEIPPTLIARADEVIE
jgi:putative tryptophan/tyrosine transport system substrate-binding protein